MINTELRRKTLAGGDLTLYHFFPNPFWTMLQGKVGKQERIGETSELPEGKVRYRTLSELSSYFRTWNVLDG